MVNSYSLFCIGQKGSSQSSNSNEDVRIQEEYKCIDIENNSNSISMNGNDFLAKALFKTAILNICFVRLDFENLNHCLHLTFLR